YGLCTSPTLIPEPAPHPHSAPLRSPRPSKTRRTVARVASSCLPLHQRARPRLPPEPDPLPTRISHAAERPTTTRPERPGQAEPAQQAVARDVATTSET